MDSDEPVDAYVRRFAEPEDEPLRAARARSEEADIHAVVPQTGALLRFLARCKNARHVVEIGTGGGYSGLWLLGGLDPRGVLVTIEIDPGNQALAQQAFAEARVADRVRSMLGPALEVLPKLADHNYDLVFLDALKEEYGEYLAHAKRLLRPGGLLVADKTLWGGKAADPAVSDAQTDGIRDFNDAVRDDPELAATLFDVGDGVLAAVSVPREQR